jgi:hypothetical protein
MKGSIFRKIAVIIIIILPLVSYEGCKKQPKCGCGKDVLFTLTNQRAYVYFNETHSSIWFSISSDPYSTYYFCNPTEMYNANMKDYVSGDELLVSGHVYWECNYLYQAGQSYYGYQYKVYNIDVTDVYMDLYGKK